jgi:hypothetical protein
MADDTPQNPYMMDGGQQLALLLMSLGSGITNAASQNRPFWAGISPGVQAFGEGTLQRQQLANQWDQWNKQYDLQNSYRKAQERELDLKSKGLELDHEATRAGLDAINNYYKGGGGTGGTGGDTTLPTMRVPPGPDMGPRSYNGVTAGTESGGSYTVPNKLGSGAYGKYQFMPDTWADTASKHPELGLPFDMRKATPQQQEAAQDAFTRDNALTLSKAGIQPTPDKLYYAHRFGAGGAQAFINAPNSLPIAKLFPPEWIAQNPDLQGVTVGQFKAETEQRYANVPHMPGGPPNLMRLAPAMLSPRTAKFGEFIAGQAGRDFDYEKWRYDKDVGALERAQKQAQYERDAAVREEAERRAKANADVDPDTGKPTQGVIDATAAKAAATAKAQKDAELASGAAIKLAQDEMARYSKDVRPGVVSTANGLPNQYEMKRLLDNGVAAGPFMDKRMLGARVVDYLGLGDMPGDMISRTEYGNRAAKNVLAILQTRALGAGTGISEGDRKFVETMAASGGDYTEAELKRLNDIQIKASHLALEQHKQEVERLRKLPGVNQIDPAYFDVNAPTYEEWAKANPPVAAAPAQTGRRPDISTFGKGAGAPPPTGGKRPPIDSFGGSKFGGNKFGGNKFGASQ